MNACELTVAISVLASSIAGELSDDELSLVAAIVTQLGDTMQTILAQRDFCDKKS